MVNYNKKRRMITSSKKREDAILQDDRFLFPEDRAGYKKEGSENNKINYVRKPLALRSKMCLVLALVGLCFMIAAVVMMYNAMGNPPLNTSAVVCSSMLFALISFWYGCISFLEKDKSYLFSYIGMSVSGLQLVLIIFSVIAGGRA